MFPFNDSRQVGGYIWEVCMRYQYGEFYGEELENPDSLFGYDHIMDFIWEYGERALDAMEKMEPADAEILEKLIKDGMLDKVAGRYRLTPRAINAMQRKALMEIFAHLPRGSREGHPTANPGAGADRLEGTKKYAFGDPISELDLNATLSERDWCSGSSIWMSRRCRLPLQLSESDLELHQVEGIDERGGCAHPD